MTQQIRPVISDEAYALLEKEAARAGLKHGPIVSKAIIALLSPRTLEEETPVLQGQLQRMLLMLETLLQAADAWPKAPGTGQAEPPTAPVDSMRQFYNDNGSWVFEAPQASASPPLDPHPLPASSGTRGGFRRWFVKE